MSSFEDMFGCSESHVVCVIVRSLEFSDTEVECVHVMDKRYSELPSSSLRHSHDNP